MTEMAGEVIGEETVDEIEEVEVVYEVISDEVVRGEKVVGIGVVEVERERVDGMELIEILRR